MSPLVPLLLAALWPAVAVSEDQQPGLHITPEELWGLIDRAVAAATQPLIIKMDSRIDTLDSRLDTLDSRLDTRLDTLTSKMDTPNSVLDSLDSRLDTLDTRLDTLDSRLDVLDSRVDTLTEHRQKQDLELESINGKLNSQSSQLEEKADELDQHRTQLHGQESRLGVQESQLDSMSTRFDRQESRLDEQAAQLTNLSSELLGQASEIDDQNSRLNNHNTQITANQARLDGLSSWIDNQDSQLDNVFNKTETHRARIDGNTIRLNSLQSMTGPRDCSDLPEGSPNGVYILQLGLGGTVPVPAFCDLDADGGRWTVFQRRADIEPREDFYRRWAAYKEGFGELDKEFWWGLNNLWAMTSSRDRQYELRIDMEDFEGEKRHATYQNFRISSESDGYRLAAANYTGDAGDSLKEHIGQRFSTKDKDLDSWSGGSCAKTYKGAWWFKGCVGDNLNGQYLSGKHSGDADGVNWATWKGRNYSLKGTTMKLRPTRKLSG